MLALKAVLGEVDPNSPAAAMGATASALAADTMKSLGARKTMPGAEATFTFSSLSEASGPAVAALLDAIGLQTTGMGLVRQAVHKCGGSRTCTRTSNWWPPTTATTSRCWSPST